MPVSESDGLLARSRKQRAASLLQELRAAGLISSRFGKHGQPSAQEALLGGTQGPSRRLRHILDRLGPLFSAFGDYLATRCDALPLADLQDLTLSTRALEPTTPRRVLELVKNELPDAWRELTIEPEPATASTPVFQWHNGRYADREISLMLLRPEFETQALREAPLLDILARVRLFLHDDNALDLGDIVADFRVYLDALLDPGGQRDNLTSLADGSDDFRCLAVSRPLAKLNARRLLILENACPGQALNELQTQDEDDGDTDQARRLSLVWLQQALLSQVHPAPPLDQAMRLGEDGAFLIDGGLCAELELEERADLLRYLAAAARSDTLRACDQLLRLCDKQAGACSRKSLKTRFREAEPFRSGGWSDQYTGERFADTVFVQWRLARQGGYRLKPPFAAFARGLCVIERHARRIAPERDDVREALDDVRVIAAAVRTREYFGPGNLEENLTQMVETGAALLRKMGDRGYHEDDNNDGREHDSLQEQIKNRWTVFASLLALLLFIGMLFDTLLKRVDAPTFGGLSGEFLLPALFAGLGLLVLWIISRPYRE